MARRDEGLRTCEAVLERLYPFLLRTITAVERDGILEHLAACEGCRLGMEAVRERLEGVVEVPVVAADRRRRRSPSHLRRGALLVLSAVPIALTLMIVLQQARRFGEHRLERRFLSRLERAIHLYHRDIGSYPPDDGAPLSVYLTSRDLSGPYLDLEREVAEFAGRLDAAGDLHDRWGGRWIYRARGRQGDALFDLQSLGPNHRDDGGEGDDLANW